MIESEVFLFISVLVKDGEYHFEEEAQRRFEAAEQQALLEEQAAAERKHQKAMECNAEAQAMEVKRHNEQMEKAERERERREAQHLEQLKNAAELKCWGCAKKQWCTARKAVERSGALCSGFQPS